MDPEVTYDENKRNKNKQISLNDEKTKVRKQIDDLEKIISDIEFQLGIITYGECEIVGKSSLLNVDSKSSIRENIEDILEYELFKLSGVYCSKVTEDECVFNFSSSSRFQSPYAVQIFTKEETVGLGAWVMPWGITIDKINSETPLKSSMDVIPFLKNCKHSIQCHAEREEQFKKLKESTASIKNVSIDATLGYITILCHFLDVHDNSTDRKFNLTVNLFYAIDTVSPSSINIEWNLKKRIPENIIIKMQTFAKSFQSQNLVDAFKDIRDTPHPIYVWKAEEFTDSVLDVTDIHYFSGSNSNVEISDDENTEYNRKRRKTRRLRKRAAKPLSNKESTDKNPSSRTDNVVSSREHESNNEELSRYVSDPKPQPKKRKKEILSGRDNKQQTNPKPTAENTNSKQTELSLKGIPVGSVSINRIESPKRRMGSIEIKKAVTSTPMPLRSVIHKRQTSINFLGISPITEKHNKKTLNGTGQKKSIAINKKKKNK